MTAGAVLHLLTLAFVVLKFTGVIGWSWWLVTAPSWIALTIAFILFVAAVIGLHILNRVIKG